MITLAPLARAKSTSRPLKLVTSMIVPVRAAMGPISARTNSIRSSIGKIGPLPTFAATPTTSRSMMRAARLMMSMWPLVTGSNVPG